MSKFATGRVSASEPDMSTEVDSISALVARLNTIHSPTSLAREGIYWLYRIAANLDRIADALEGRE